MEKSPNIELSSKELSRYARHLMLPEVGKKGQILLKDSSVLVVGAGGLGSPVALYLAAAGIGTLGLVDFDEVDVTNLQRQILYGTEDIGKPKLESAYRRIFSLNPHVEVISHPCRLDSQNALEILENYDVVVDGTDNFPTRYLVNDACVLLGKPSVYGSIFRWEGQVSVFGKDDGPCYRCLFREPPPPGMVPSCAEAGVLGVLPGIIGSLQALEVIKIVLGQGESLVGRLLIFDALELKWREVKIRRNPDCPVCGNEPTQTELIDYDVFCGVASDQFEDQAKTSEKFIEIKPSELRDRLKVDPPPFLLDVREPFEWDIVNLSDLGAFLIPLGELSERIAELPSDREIVVHCRSGVRSAKAADILSDSGFSGLYNLNGGILGWIDEVDPCLPKY
ncbi:MAG TPA: molybdopterin-synthase adenylyltransferase MoeB [Gemmatimonadetes bacterium]|nr:molybdopterin-synthase adenylyltransferase MoeB [Gemmatimonadota bacterium]